MFIILKQMSWNTTYSKCHETLYSICPNVTLGFLIVFHEKYLWHLLNSVPLNLLYKVFHDICCTGCFIAISYYTNLRSPPYSKTIPPAPPFVKKLPKFFNFSHLLHLQIFNGLPHSFAAGSPGSITSPEGFLMSGGKKCIFEKQFFEI